MNKCAEAVSYHEKHLEILKENYEDIVRNINLLKKDLE